MKMIRKMQDVPRQMVMYLGERRQARRSIESQRTDSQVEGHYTCGGESGSSGHMIGKPMEKNKRQNEVQSTRNESRIFLGASQQEEAGSGSQHVASNASSSSGRHSMV
ncbi:hypothetical protein FF2_037668 [Malus domestica]